MKTSIPNCLTSVWPTMKSHVCALLFLCLAFAQAMRADSGPVVIWKFDDLAPGQGAPFTPQWTKLFDYIEGEKMPISVGIITKSLERGGTDYLLGIQRLNASGLVEFWNHGYLHDQDKTTGTSEFRGTTYEHQLERFSTAQRLAREKLGFPFHTFGAPYNHIDETTQAVVKTDPDIQIWLYGPSNYDDIKVLKLAIGFEPKTGVVEYDYFVKEFTSRPGEPYYVLQAHPGYWKEGDFDAFTRIVDFLKSKDARFMTPSAYHSEKK